MIQVLLEMGKQKKQCLYKACASKYIAVFASGSMLFMCDYCKKARIKFNITFIMACSPT